MTYQYRELFSELQLAVDDRPGGAIASFEVNARSAAGLSSTASARRFEIDVDQPRALGGGDAAPGPAEYLLAALAASQQSTYRYYADALNVPLDAVGVHVEGDIDLRGLFAVDPMIRPGFGDIVVTVELTSSATEADLRRLKAAVDSHCPILDTLRNSVPVHLGLEFRV